MSVLLLNALRSGVLSVKYQSKCYSQDSVVAANIGYMPEGLCLWELNTKNQHMRQSLIDESIVPADLLNQAKDLHYQAFNEVRVYVRDGYEWVGLGSKSGHVWEQKSA